MSYLASRQNVWIRYEGYHFRFISFISLIALILLGKKLIPSDIFSSIAVLWSSEKLRSTSNNRPTPSYHQFYCTMIVFRCLKLTFNAWSCQLLLKNFHFNYSLWSPYNKRTFVHGPCIYFISHKLVKTFVIWLAFIFL